MKNNFYKEKKLFILGLIIAFICATIDLASKKVIFAILENKAAEEFLSYPKIIVTSFFNLVYVWNKGVSFGIFNSIDNSRIIFSFIQFSIVVILTFWLFYNEKKHYMIAISLIIGGALGNVIDRLQHGAVADFLDFYIKFNGEFYHWPAFNMADSFVFIGAFILIFDEIIFNKQTNNKQTNEKNKS